MLNGISKEAIELSKITQIKCVGFTENGEDYDTDWQKLNFKKSLSKSKSRILIGSPNIISSDVLFVNAFKILNKHGYSCYLLTPFYLKEARCIDLIKKCNEYDYIFIGGLGTNQDTLDVVRRLLVEYDIGLVISYFMYYKDYYKNQVVFKEHNPIQYDNEQLGYGAFDSYVYQEKVFSQKKIISLKK